MTGHADMVLLNGRVLTVDDAFTVASALAVTGDRITAVGADDEVRALAGPSTTVVDLDGRTVLPGLNDAHLHLAMFGLAGPPFSADLNGVASLADLRAALADGPPGPGGSRWLIGEGWREANIPEFDAADPGPHRSLIDEVTGDRPTVLHHASRHSVLVNTAALRIAGITRDTPDPAGGHIVRDRAGEPSGLLLEGAKGLVTPYVPAHSETERLDAIESAMRTLNALGITSVTDPIVWPELLRDYTTLRRQGRMTVRVNALLHWDWPSPASSSERLETALGYAGLSTGLGDDWLRVGGLKLFADGVPTQCTAWLHEPYPAGGHGSLITSGDDDDARYEELLRSIELGHRNRLQVQVHVTGDRAADAAADGLIRALKEDPWPDARHALIHGTLLNEDGFARLAEHDISVITSSLMKSHSGASMTRAIGADRWSRAFPAGALLAAGVHVADSSDAPVTFPDWRRGIATFTGSAPGPFAEVPPDLRLTREQAVRLWTTAGAYLEHAEDRKGTLTPGSLADLVVLDGDPVTADADALRRITPVLTVVGGRVVHTGGTSG
ncbi:amidohydrolase [Actinomadura chibensis]|uniref:Amidohydrolase n=1 Tax=Actinomadura chibensis TaxID=392828 RepID=A0A5D0NCH1_9ACTN|nr:amidohydrolase [Actinomadura chibensis]TYB42194.1 amidohydrolase [Actinomadura chibensis]